MLIFYVFNFYIVYVYQQSIYNLSLKSDSFNKSKTQMCYI